MFKITILAMLVMLASEATPALSAGQPGTTDTVFNKRFIHTLKPMMPYDQLVRMLGTAGTKVGEDKKSSPPKTMYHWNGKRKSALDIKVAAGKVVEAIVTAPKKQRFALGKNGELVEL
jgi:hypothetical protein